MKTFLALAMASVARMAWANIELSPRDVETQEAPPVYKALCPTCCKQTILRTTIRETFFSTETQTVSVTTTEYNVSTQIQHETEYVTKTATQHDVSTQIQQETKFVTKTSVSTFTTSYPVTVTKLTNCTRRPLAPSAALKERTYPTSQPPLECETVTTTEWRTATSTKTVLVPTVSIVPTTLTNTKTVTQTRNQSVTVWLPTTYTTTITRTSQYPVTVTSEHDVTVTRTATTTETIISTVTTSYPVVTHDTITLPGSTVVLPGTTVTATASPTKITLCPSPTGLSAPLPPNSNLTFGCSPGSVCAPRMPEGCNTWPGPPSDNFLCCASDCIPSPQFTLTHWRDNETSYYLPSPGYYNLDPTKFGLAYDIFEKPAVGRDQERRSLVKRATAPSQCFDECNNVLVMAQSGGKTDELCRVGSPFRLGFEACSHCIELHAKATGNVLDNYVGPVFKQFLNFCKGRRSEPQTSSVEALPGKVTSPAPEPKTSTQPLQTSTQVDASSGTFGSPSPSTTATSVSQTGSVSPKSSTPPVSVTQSSASTTTGDAKSSAESVSTTERSDTTKTSTGSSSVTTTGGVNTKTGASSSSSTGSSVDSTKSDSSVRGTESTPSASSTRAFVSTSTGSDTARTSKTVSTTISALETASATASTSEPAPATTSAPKATSSTGGGGSSSVTGNGTSTIATLEVRPTVIVNAATVRFGIGGAAKTLVVAMAVFILV